jgi:PAS domain S-box-containing protein
VKWNDGAGRIKGYTAQEILGEHFSLFYPRVEVEANVPGRALEKATAAGRHEDQGWRMRKDGTRFWANVVITALRDALGVLVGFCVVTRDMTREKQAQDDVGDLQRELERSNRRLREADGDLLALSAAAAQDLRAVAGGEVLAPVIEGLDELCVAVTQTLRRAVVDMNALVEHAWREVAPPGAALSVGPLPAAFGDRHLLQRLWIHLLDSSVRCGGTQPQIEVAGYDAGNDLVFSIGDDCTAPGAGSPARIFDIFRRLPGGAEGGSAVGLAIAQRIVKRHHGSIWAHAPGGERAQVSFSLPRRP